MCHGSPAAAGADGCRAARRNSRRRGAHLPRRREQAAWMERGADLRYLRPVSVAFTLAVAIPVAAGSTRDFVEVAAPIGGHAIGIAQIIGQEPLDEFQTEAADTRFDLFKRVHWQGAGGEGGWAGARFNAAEF